MEFLNRTWAATLLCRLSLVSLVDAVGRLYPMNVQKNLITLSGFSSGGTMAQHMFVSHSSIFHGVATISHGFYRCGPGVVSSLTLNNYDLFDAVCTKLHNTPVNQLYDPARAVADIVNYFSLGIIDDPGNMRDKSLYIFAGLTNYWFPLQIGAGAVQVFEPFIRNRNKIKVVVQTANVTLPVDRPGCPPCAGPTNVLQISDCGFYAALEALQWIIGKTLVRPPNKNTQYNLQPLLEFDQTEFFHGFGPNVINANHFMDYIGYYYIPTPCRGQGHKCLLHFYFHGCMTGRSVVGPEHILNSGYIEVAEENEIIVVFPQTIADARGQRMGCWDTYGYTGEGYATKIGAQVIVVKNMIDRILGLDNPSSFKSFLTDENLYQEQESTRSTNKSFPNKNASFKLPTSIGQKS